MIELGRGARSLIAASPLAMSIAALTTALLIGCGADKPSASDGERAVSGQIDAGRSEKARLTNFLKTDGKITEGQGVKT